MTGLFRAYVRYVPHAPLRRPIARELVDRRLKERPHEFRTRTRTGLRFDGTTADLIDRYLYEFGLWEPNLTRFVCGRLHPGDVFLDVGANIGYFTLLAANLVGAGGTVIAVEADPDTINRLRHHIQLNGARNVELHQVAAARTRGVLTLHRVDAQNRGATTTVAPTQAAASSVDVDARPLADLLTADQLSRLRLIKMDIEGAERDAVIGLLPVINLMPVNVELVVELTPGGSPDAARDVIRLMGDRGFHAYELGNSYRPGDYAAAPLERPRRLRSDIARRTDVVFSRIDADEL